MSAKSDCLDEKTRAEDILLGALGFDADATIIDVKATTDGYSGRARWSDGEEFDFASEDDLDDLEKWAVSILDTNSVSAQPGTACNDEQRTKKAS